MTFRDRQPAIWCVLLGTIGCVTATAHGASAESRAVALPPRSKFLLLDSRVVESVQNAKLAVGTVQKHKDNPLFKEDQPWEPRYDNVYANVIYDEQQELYKCWYSPFVNDPAYANTLPEDRKPGTYMQTLRQRGQNAGWAYATPRPKTAFTGQSR